MKITTIKEAILFVLVGLCLENQSFAKGKSAKMTEVTEQCWTDGKGGEFCQEVERKEVDTQETSAPEMQSSDRGMPVGNASSKAQTRNQNERDFTVSSANKSASMKKLALVIGNSNYSDSPLKNPVNDARSMSRALQNLGFSVIAKENLTQEAMNDAVRDFGDRLTSGTVGLFYFAGHGMQVKGKNYLIPINSGIKREDEVPYRAFDANQLLAKMDSAHNGLNLVILDACRNNPFERSFRSGETGLAPMDAPSGTMIAYAAKPGMKSKDSDGGNNGLYTGTLLKYISTPNLTIEQLFKKVRIEVKNSSNSQQISWEEGGLESDFCFAGCNGNPTLISQPAPEPSLQQMATPAPVEQTYTPPQPAVSNSRYQIMGNEGGIVKDTQTGLMWMRCSIGQTWNGSTCTGEAQKMDWNSAMALRNSYGGYSDWRLPNKSELESLVYCSDGNYARLDRDKGGFICGSNTTNYNFNKIKQTISINFPIQASLDGWKFWSFSSSLKDSSDAWVIDFSMGYLRLDGKYENYNVRLVRSGQ